MARTLRQLSRPMFDSVTPFHTILDTVAEPHVNQGSGAAVVARFHNEPTLEWICPPLSLAERSTATCMDCVCTAATRVIEECDPGMYSCWRTGDAVNFEGDRKATLSYRAEHGRRFPAACSEVAHPAPASWQRNAVVQAVRKRRLVLAGSMELRPCSRPQCKLPWLGRLNPSQFELTGAQADGFYHIYLQKLSALMSSEAASPERSCVRLCTCTTVTHANECRDNLKCP